VADNHVYTTEQNINWTQIEEERNKNSSKQDIVVERKIIEYELKRTAIKLEEVKNDIRHTTVEDKI